jgi:hypothetical protein
MELDWLFICLLVSELQVTVTGLVGWLFSYLVSLLFCSFVCYIVAHLIFPSVHLHRTTVFKGLQSWTVNGQTQEGSIVTYFVLKR